MLKKKRKYCPYCSKSIISKNEGDMMREYCPECQLFFYNNPLPVVSTIVIKGKQILLIKRRNPPYKGKWCLPSGFAEIGESIQDAALRELKEETGIDGMIIGFVDVNWTKNYYYGDLIFHTFEVEQTGGITKAGDDAIDVKYFPINGLPKLAFKPNIKAIETFIKKKSEYWSIIDSFSLSIDEMKNKKHKPNYLSDLLAEMIENNVNLLSERWINEVNTNKSTTNYKKNQHDILFLRINTILSQLGKWLKGYNIFHVIPNFYYDIGKKRKAESFELSEVLSALSLLRKHIWEFALSQGLWQETSDIYRTLELERRIMLFFDRASYQICKGYEKNHINDTIKQKEEER
jgi:8-oxo-dGTP diphosphatase